MKSVANERSLLRISPFKPEEALERSAAPLSGGLFRSIKAWYPTYPDEGGIQDAEKATAAGIASVRSSDPSAPSASKTSTSEYDGEPR